MAGPEAKGRLRRDWRHEIMATIADEDGNFDPDLWNRLNEKVAGMVRKAQAEAWDEGVEAADRAAAELRSSDFHTSGCDCGTLGPNPYEDEA